MPISPDFVEVLRCPMGLSELELDGERLLCKRCGPVFHIKDGIPDLLIEDAELPPGCRTIQDLPCVKAGDAKSR